MNHFLDLLKNWGPIGAFLAAFIDGIGLPNPGGPDYLVLFLAWKLPESAYLTGSLAALGALLGTGILYWISRKGGERFLDKRAHGPRALEFRSWFQRYGMVTVFIPALVPMIPLPMKVFVICAGAFAVNPVVFMLVLAAGKIPRYLALAYLGKELGEHSTAWLKQHRWQFTGGALALLLLLFLLVRVAGVVHQRRTGQTA